MQLAGFLEALNDSASPKDVFDQVYRSVSPFGYEQIGLFSINKKEKRADLEKNVDTDPIIISNYSESFLQNYLGKKRYEIDPVLPLARDNITPVVWDDVVGRMTLSEEQKQLVIERRHAGLHSEVTCPIHGSHANILALRFARQHAGPCDRANLGALQVLAIHFYYAFARSSEKEAKNNDTNPGLSDVQKRDILKSQTLSQREAEVLLWTARGKSASSISIILGLSENTVNFYVKNAMRKLGTTNRVVAVVLAVRLGLIQP